MRRWIALVTVIGLWIGPRAATAAETALADFYGEWRGVEATAEGLQGLEPPDLDVAIRPDGAGFRMRWMSLASATDAAAARQGIEVSFDPTGKPGVFAYREEPGSLFERLFASPASTNPLEGETLLWARLEGPRLTVYSLALTSAGDFRLDRYERTLRNGTMSLHATRRTGDGAVVTVEGRLERAEG